MPAKSKAQQRFMGMVHATQKGDMKAPSKEVADAAKSITPGDAKDFAETKQTGLPEKKEEKKSMIDINKLNPFDLKYIEGFIQKCAEANVDPEVMLAKLAEGEPEPKKEEPKKEEPKAKPKSTVKKVMGGVGKGGVAGAAIGGALGAGGGAMMASAAPKGQRLAQVLKGLIAGTAGGAAQGALTGGVMRSVA